MKGLKIIVILSLLIAVLAAAASAAGLFLPGHGEAYTFTTIRGYEAEIYGQGLYRYDSVFTGANFWGQDSATLFIAVPLLLLFLVLFMTGSHRAGLLLLGMLTYFLYVYSTMALAAMFNELYLLYVLLFSLSFFAVIILYRKLSLNTLQGEDVQRLPRKAPGIYFIVSGILTLSLWLEPVISAMLNENVPELVGHYTTTVTFSLDLALITPAAVLSGIMILRKKAEGYAIAFMLLGVIVMLGPVITLGTISQIRAGVSFTPAEIIGPISGFLVLALVSIWIIISILRKLPR
ncbi:MAG: hypothetical protein ACLFR1_09755 [Spirochaetia bacterium]